MAGSENPKKKLRFSDPPKKIKILFEEGKLANAENWRDLKTQKNI
jgi:hypothetical protein